MNRYIDFYFNFSGTSSGGSGGGHGGSGGRGSALTTVGQGYGSMYKPDQYGSYGGYGRDLGKEVHRGLSKCIKLYFFQKKNCTYPT